MKKLLFSFSICILFLIISGCSETPSKEAQIGQKVISNTWDTVLTNIQTGETFTIADLKGKNILLESFAVWCPVCTAQQEEIKKLHEEDNSFISISLNTDPNEDEGIIKEHIERNGFNWIYAISPIDFTQTLIDIFGFDVINAPSAPIILICPDQSTRFLPRGLKKADTLKLEIAKGCSYAQ